MKTLKTKLLVFVTILMLGMTAAAPAFSADCGIKLLSSGKECRNEAISVNTDGINDNAARIEQVNDEDQRLTDGTFDASSGSLTLYTQDMVAGDDDDIARRSVVVTGFEALRGSDGFGTEADFENLKAEIQRVDDEDMRVKSGKVVGDTLTLIVADEKATGNRSEPFSREVDIDVSSLRGKDGFGTKADLDRVENRIEQVNQEDHRAVGGSLNNGTLTINTEDMDGGSKRTFTVDGDFNAESKANQLDIETNRSRIEQVNLEDQRLKDGEVNANGDLVLYTEDQPDGQSRRAVTVDGFKTNVTDKIAENEGRLDDNDVTNNRQDRDIATNAGDINSVQDQANFNTGGMILNSLRISGNDRDIRDNQRDIDLNAYGIETNRRAIVDTNARIDGVMNDMRYLDRNLSAGIASAVAMGQHNFDPTYQGGQVSIAGGHFNGANAVSLAVGVPAGSNAFFSLSAAANDGPGNESIGMGLTYRLP